MKKFLLFVGVICFAFALMGCGQEEEAKQPDQEKAGKAVESATEQAQDAGEESAGAVEEAGKKAGQATEAAKEKVRQAAETAKEKASESAESAKEKAGEAVSGMKEKAGKAASAAKEEAAQTAETIKEKAGETAAAAKAKAAQAAAAAGGLAVIEMKNEEAFSQHRMGIVEFDHKAHVTEYGLGCGKCHHDKNHEPLNDLSYDEPVKGCFECHDKTGRPRREESMSEQQWQKERIQYYYGAIHENCMGCHEETKGPTQCTQCHPRPEK